MPIPSASVILPLLLLLGVFLYARYIEPRTVIIKRVRIDTGKDINRGRPLRIALLSDLHYPRFSSIGLVREAIARSNQFDPDLVFILGDLFDKNRQDPAILPENVREVFQGIRSRLGVFGVLGNHDHWFDAKAIRDRIASDTEIRLIDNRAVAVELSGATVSIVGIGDLWSKDADYDRAVREVPSDSPILLLSHNPDTIETIKDPRILVQFSGHTHGGQVRLPFIGALKVPSKFGNRYCKGLIETGNHTLYVNSGICSMRNIRFLCPPEVTWIEMS